MENNNQTNNQTNQTAAGAATRGESPREAGLRYLAAGLVALPALRGQKRPALASWRDAAAGKTPRDALAANFAPGRPGDAVCIACGAASGNLECIDFDNGAEKFRAWADALAPALARKLAVETTRHGGRHVVYRCEEPVEGNMKLARGMRGGTLKTLIETRGEGGVFLCAPTPGYEPVYGSLAAPSVLSAAERAALLDAARALDETPAATPATPAAAAPAAGASGALPRDESTRETGLRPGDDFNARGNLRPWLLQAGWLCVGRGDGGRNELWRRPGKPQGGHSATFDGRTFYVFSSNAAPFEPGKGYSPFNAYALLAHGGDFSAAAKALAKLGYGEPEPPAAKTPAPASAAIPAAPGVLARGEIPRAARRTVGSLVRDFPALRAPVIDGLLRRGETMNVIAPPKTGKTWFVNDLALAVATGGEWFGFKCEKGRVLLIDNELHCETSANRIARIAAARGLAIDDVADGIIVENQRGRLSSIEDFAQEIDELRPLGIKLAIVDAFYRALPRGASENDNGAVTILYNMIDAYSEALGCAFVLIHHTSKGSQSQKNITDIGSGAGAQSRAADTHLVLRPHKEPGCVVMDAAVRSFPPVAPVALRWNWPVWERDPSLDPSALL